jgi:hypothetical protein
MLWWRIIVSPSIFSVGPVSRCRCRPHEQRDETRLEDPGRGAASGPWGGSVHGRPRIKTEGTSASRQIIYASDVQHFAERHFEDVSVRGRRRHVENDAIFDARIHQVANTTPRSAGIAGSRFAAIASTPRALHAARQSEVRAEQDKFVSGRCPHRGDPLEPTQDACMTAHPQLRPFMALSRC